MASSSSSSEASLSDVADYNFSQESVSRTFKGRPGSTTRGPDILDVAADIATGRLKAQNVTPLQVIPAKRLSCDNRRLCIAKLLRNLGRRADFRSQTVSSCPGLRHLSEPRETVLYGSRGATRCPSPELEAALSDRIAKLTALLEQQRRERLRQREQRHGGQPAPPAASQPLEANRFEDLYSSDSSDSGAFSGEEVDPASPRAVASSSPSAPPSRKALESKHLTEVRRAAETLERGGALFVLCENTINMGATSEDFRRSPQLVFAARDRDDTCYVGGLILFPSQAHRVATTLLQEPSGNAPDFLLAEFDKQNVTITTGFNVMVGLLIRTLKGIGLGEAKVKLLALFNDFSMCDCDGPDPVAVNPALWALSRLPVGRALKLALLKAAPGDTLANTTVLLYTQPGSRFFGPVTAPHARCVLLRSKSKVVHLNRHFAWPEPQSAEEARFMDENTYGQRTSTKALTRRPPRARG